MNPVYGLAELADEATGWPTRTVQAWGRYLEDPNFDDAGRDWRRCVIPEFRKMWADLSLETQLVIFIHAYGEAKAEGWV